MVRELYPNTAVIKTEKRWPDKQIIVYSYPRILLNKEFITFKIFDISLENKLYEKTSIPKDYILGI